MVSLNSQPVLTLIVLLAVLGLAITHLFKWPPFFYYGSWTVALGAYQHFRRKQLIQNNGPILIDPGFSPRSYLLFLAAVAAAVASIGLLAWMFFAGIYSSKIEGLSFASFFGAVAFCLGILAYEKRYFLEQGIYHTGKIVPWENVSEYKLSDFDQSQILFKINGQIEHISIAKEYRSAPDRDFLLYVLDSKISAKL
ncbi:hypothetical protein [Calycomorphotria hydatis]|uniref:DUF5673 domain-containing protein n=1 Tax=Calycomorphotria hydatis TaxID=2528027 RepID=A0A517T3Y0_9PLAN|nr:hypothetical protein [Calycomorphotria hydatis]QDT63080.1 hypothetical protein V22_02800 [Calycomorphotria hydatis]